MVRKWLSGIRARSIAAVGLIILLFAAMFASNYSLTQDSLSLLDRSAKITFPTLQTIDQAIAKLKEYRESLQAAIATNDQFAIEDAHVIGKDIEALIQEAGRIDPTLLPRIAPILTHFSKYSQSSEHLTRRVIAREVSLSGENPEIKSYFDIQERNTKLFYDLRNEIHGIFVDQIRQTSQAGEKTISSSLLLISISTLIAFVILVFLQKSIIAPILNLTDSSLKVAKGVFERAPSRQGNDEVSLLTQNYNKMIVSLEKSSHAMSSIITYGRAMATSSDLRKLRSALAEGLASFTGQAVSHSFWVSQRMLYRGAAEGEMFCLIDSQGQILAHRRSREHLESRLHQKIRTHHDEAVIAYVLLEEDLEEALSETTDFLEAAAINIASALDSIKLQDTLNLVEEQSQSIQTILNNINQGICTIDEKLEICGSYSPALERIVGQRNLTGRNFFDLVLARSNLDAEQKSILANLLRVCNGSDILTFEMNQHLLVRELQWGEPNARVTCELDWYPLLDGESMVEKFMIVLRDVTAIRSLQETAAENSKKLQLIGVLLNLDPRRFNVVMSECKNILLEMKQRVQAHSYLASYWQDARLDLHTEKGNLRTLELKALATQFHELEDELDRYLSRPSTRGSDHASRFLGKLRQALSEVSRIEDIFLHTLKRGETPEQGLATSSMRMLEGLQAGARSLATELGRKEPRIHWEGCHVVFKPEAYDIILSSFGHLVRNSIDHGFGHPNPDSEDVIQISCQISAEKDLQITYRDSGRGLDIVCLHEKAKSSPGSTIYYDDETIAELIFIHGISSRSDVTETSGRGIGMNAVRSSFDELDGTIRIRFTSPKPEDGFRPFVLDIRLGYEKTLLRPKMAHEGGAA